MASRVIYEPSSWVICGKILLSIHLIFIHAFKYIKSLTLFRCTNKLTKKRRSLVKNGYLSKRKILETTDKQQNEKLLECDKCRAISKYRGMYDVALAVNTYVIPWLYFMAKKYFLFNYTIEQMMVVEVEANFHEGLRRLDWVENQYFHMVGSSGSFGYDELLHVATIKESLWKKIYHYMLNTMELMLEALAWHQHYLGRSSSIEEFMFTNQVW